MYKCYEENKKLKEEIEYLKAQYYKMCDEENGKLFSLSYYKGIIDDLQEKVKQLQKELTELYEKNYKKKKKLNKE